MATIGFIGLGNMGLPMAGNLLKAGHRLQVHDLAAARTAVLAAEGAVVVAGAAEAATGADVAEIYLGGGGLIEAAAPGTLLIDCSTIDVATARRVAAAAERRGLAMLDAPVSG